jgi:hypothetical protein
MVVNSIFDYKSANSRKNFFTKGNLREKNAFGPKPTSLALPWLAKLLSQGDMPILQDEI